MLAVEPSTNPHRPSTAGFPASRSDARIDTMNTTEPNYDFDRLTLWETGMFASLDPMDVLGMAEDGTFPAPVSQWPLRWAEQDVCQWWHAKPKESAVC